jgi:hypothetical protein
LRSRLELIRSGNFYGHGSLLLNGWFGQRRSTGNFLFFLLFRSLAGAGFDASNLFVEGRYDGKIIKYLKLFLGISRKRPIGMTEYIWE